jgi:hypothetical protein
MRKLKLYNKSTNGWLDTYQSGGPILDKKEKTKLTEGQEIAFQKWMDENKYKDSDTYDYRNLWKEEGFKNLQFPNLSPLEKIKEIESSKDFELDQFYKKYPHVAGMSHSLNEVSRNPYSVLPKKNLDAVISLEKARSLMTYDKNAPKPNYRITKKQNQFFKNIKDNSEETEDYADANKQIKRETIASRSFVGDEMGNAPYTKAQNNFVYKLIQYAKKKPYSLPDKFKKFDEGGMVEESMLQEPPSEEEFVKVYNPKTGKINKVPKHILHRQIFRESSFNPKAVSKANARGLAQIRDDAFKDAVKAGIVKKTDDLFDPKTNKKIQEYYMNDLYNADFINKPNQDPQVRIAKALVAYNFGRTNLFNHLTKMKSKGVDIYNSFDWLKGLPKESVDYQNDILHGKNPKFEEGFKKLAPKNPYENGGLLKYPNGGKLKKEGNITKLNSNEEFVFDTFKKSLPSNLQEDTPGFDLRGWWKSKGSPLKFNRLEEEMNGSVDNEGYFHATSRNPETGEYFKSIIHPTTQTALNFDKKGTNPYLPSYKNGILSTNQLENKKMGGVIKLYKTNDYRKLAGGGFAGAMSATQGGLQVADTVNQLFGEEGDEFGVKSDTGAVAGGALSGAAQGASMGSMFGPWGTAIGAVAGGIYGGVTSSKKNEEAKQAKEAFRKKQQENQINAENNKYQQLLNSGFKTQGNMDAKKYAKFGGKLKEPIILKETYASGGYVVKRSSEREGKTHVVIGPDGTKKYFGDSKLGQHPNDPERKKAFYARHKHNLDNNPYFRAFARKTWRDGGIVNSNWLDKL